MNAFVAHHRESIALEYSCFDRVVLNAIVQTLQKESNAAWFLKERRGMTAVTKSALKSISHDYHASIKRWSQVGIPVVEAPSKNDKINQKQGKSAKRKKQQRNSGLAEDERRRENFVVPYFQRLGDATGIAVILKSRENARLAVSYPTSGLPHVEMKYRFVWQYYFYLRDQDFGPMFIRVCPYFPFNARVCINGHEWLACQLRREGIGFRQEGNAFLDCDDPGHLQQLADEFSPAHVEACVHRWLAQLVPFYSDAERRRQGFGYRLFFSQVEYCHNLVFHRRASLDRLMERLLDENRTIGRPDKISFIYGRRRTQRRVAGLRTRISDYHLSNPVIRSSYEHTDIKQYVRDYRLLRTESVSNHVGDLGINKGVENLPALRNTMRAVTDRYLEAQQDVLESYVDRGQLARLREPTVRPPGRRIPGVKLDDPRLLAVMQALVRFSPLATGGEFRTRDLHEPAARALGLTPETYKLTQLRYDLSKLRAKGLVTKVAQTQRYRLTREGYRVCVLFLKLVHRIYAPLTAATLEPVEQDAIVPSNRLSRLDTLYRAVDRALSDLCEHVGLARAG
jgi:hypothetical protein